MSSRVVSSIPAYEPMFKQNGSPDVLVRPKLRRGISLKRTPLKKESRIRRLQSRVYSVKRKQFMHDHPICEFGECFARSEECHHVHLRNGKNYLDSSTWLALCRNHHRFIHDNARWARENGLLR